MLEQASLFESEEDLAAASAARPAQRLLVIDDDHLHRMIICRVAAKAGYLPAGAATYEEAAQLAQDTAFDCISLDLSLGDHVGIEMLRHLWIIGCKAPIIIISGCDDATCSETVKVAESLKLNVWDSIPKPVNLAVLRDCLDRLRASRDEAAADPQQTPQISPA
jgi:two-component system, chemotaxis family, chemotaxis protein CheY